MLTERIWLSWEKQRRTIEMAREFSAELVIHEPSNESLFRYASLILRTLITLIKKNPKVLFVQNPSMVLAFLACVLKPFFKYYLIIDRHTNFKLDHRNSNNPKWLIFHCLSKFTNNNADAVIVTNKYLSMLIKNQCKKILVLPDKIPNLPLIPKDNKNTESISGLFICTFAHDEPFREVLKAASDLPSITLYVTGKFQKALSEAEINSIPDNIKLLGFIPDHEYFEMLINSNFTIILTDQEFTLNCGSYESIAAEVPMLLSSTRTIRKYFEKGAEYTDPSDAKSIYNSLVDLTNKLSEKTDEIPRFRKELELDWIKKKEYIELTIERFL